MFGSNILDAAIGLLFVYVVLSLICSAAHEILEGFLKYRSSDLERGLRELLESNSQNTMVTETVYNHPLIGGLFKGKYVPGKTHNLPSYIPAHNFALAVMDIAGGVAGAVAARADGTAVLRAGILQKLPPSNAQTALLALVDAAGGDLVCARENIEKWYNSSMERVSGWYKRRSQVIIFVLGLAVAVGVNASTIDIAQKLATDTAVRNSLVPLAQAAMASKDAAQPAQPAQTPEKSPSQVISDQLSQLNQTGLPVGWLNGFPKQSDKQWSLVFGWLLTAIAVSLGAPFWFDMLNKFISFRTSLKPADAKAK